MEGTSEDLYDYNAPQHYFDFNDRFNEEPDDSYFDCQEGSGPLKLLTPLVDIKSSKPLRPTSRQNMGTPRRQEPNTPRDAQVTGRTPNRRLPKKITPKEIPAEPMKMETDVTEDSEDKENTPQIINIPHSASKGKETKKRTKSFSPGTGVRSSPRLAAIAKAMRRSNAARRSNGSGSRISSSSLEGASLAMVNKQKTQNRPSVPKVSGMKGLTQKDHSEIEAIANFKHKMANNKKKGESLTSGPRLAPTVPHEFNFATDTRLRRKNTEEQIVPSKSGPLKAVRNGPTRPQEFHFATDSRIKRQASVEEEENKAFPLSLRSGSGVTEKDLPKGPTIPQPFNLTETRKGASNELSKFVSVAELNLKFHTRTPQRFRSKRSGELEAALNQNKKNKSGVTIPVTPNLTTRGRSRQVAYLTREEMEQKEYEEQQKNKFKAKPVNKRVFEQPEGYQVERKSSTIPEPFNITKSKKEETPFGGNLKEMCSKLGCSTSSIASLPWGGVPSKWEKTSTKIQPFSFDSRDKDKFHRKQEKIQKVIEDEKKLADFHAQPMPIFEEGIRGVPEKKPPTPTRVKAFNLRSDKRGEIKREQIERNLEEEERLDQERRIFHAQSDAILHKLPFLPEKSKKPLTDISGFTLNTEVRAEARADFELHQKQKEDELLAAKKEREERQAAEEAAEIAKMRREAVHKAQPMRNYKPMEIKPAPCPPTVPISPKFATKARLRSRNSNSNTSVNSTMNISSATFTSE